MKKTKTSVIYQVILFFVMITMLFETQCLLGKPQENVVFAGNNDVISLPVKSYYLMDIYNEKMLVGSNENVRLEVASMVKLMTTLLTMEKIEKGEWSLNTMLLTSDYAASMEGSQAFLDAGSEYSVDELLKSIVVASANDSCVVIAENMSGSEQSFVDLMNTRAQELGMTNTLYANCTGLPATMQYSCAKDVAHILAEVYKHDIYHKYSTIWMDKIVHPSGRETELVNTNRLIRYYPGCDSGKTGFTDEAGYCLSASASKNGMRLVSVVIGAKSSAERFEHSTALLNYGFNNYENRKLISNESVVEGKYKIKGIKDEIEVRSDMDMYILTKRGDKNVDAAIKIDFEVKKAKHIAEGEKVGTIYLIENGIVTKECNLVSAKEYKAYSYKDAIQDVFDSFRLY